MEEKELKGLTFIKCRTPTYFVRNGVKQYVACGHCDICQKVKGDKYSQSLQLEERHHPYVFFITLTYNDEFIPRYEICDMNAYWSIERQKSRIEMAVAKGKGDLIPKTKEVLRFDVPLKEVELRPAFMRFYPVKGTNRYELKDAQEDYPIIKTSINEKKLQTYYKHREEYVEKYSQTGVEYPRGVMDLCPKRDLETFLLRLKNFAVRKCNRATFRYFAVPDYGTNSLRPHWHIELFTHSRELYDSLSETFNQGSQQRPSYTSKCISDIWFYGITNCTRVEKSTASYVSSYLNKSSYDAEFLNSVVRQRCYHSSHLGAVLPKETIRKEIKERNFGYFECLKDYTYDGVEYEYRWRSSLMCSFLPRLPYVNPKNYNGIFQIYRWTRSFIQKCQKGLGKPLPLTVVANALYDVSRGTDAPQWLKDYGDIQDSCGDYYHRDINTIYSLILNVNKFDRMMQFFQVDLSEMCHIVSDYYDYRAISGLRSLYTALENPALSAVYYKQLETDFKENGNSPYFTEYIDSISESLANNIKHKEMADRYRFNQ